MAYTDNFDENFLYDIFKRKEFYKYYLDPIVEAKRKKKWENIKPIIDIDKMISKQNILNLNSYQLFVNNFFNPNTPYKRMLLKWDTGSGKTITSISIALNYIKYYKMETDIENIGSIFIIGFTESTFKADMIKFTEFGFISDTEKIKLAYLKKMAQSKNKIDVSNLHEFIIMINKRFSNRKNNGFFKFFGYKALVNRLFITNDLDINISNITEDEIFKLIKENKILINTVLLEQFKNSLIICDEIHNVYNTIDKNNWGIALQYILNYHKSIHAIFMSATPINNSPSEIIDLFNLLIPNINLKKQDYFNNDELLPNAISKIGEISRGYISVVRDLDKSIFPSKSFIGETITEIKYLKFIRCPMNPIHYDTYKKVFTGVLSQDSIYLMDFSLPNPDKNGLRLYQTNQIKNIMNAPIEWKKKNNIDFIKDRLTGTIFKNNLKDISTKYFTMLNNIKKSIIVQTGKIMIYHNLVKMSGVLLIQEILSQNGFISNIENSYDSTVCVICGDIKKNHITKGGNDNIDTNSNIISKYTDDGVLWIQYIEKDNIIYIPSGCLFDISKFNIFFKESDNIVIESDLDYINEIISDLKFKFKKIEIDDKIYYVTQNINNVEFPHIIFGGGLNKQKHIFKPARYTIVNSDMPRSQILQNIEEFNSPTNTFGENILILIGSKLIKESYDFKAIRILKIMSRPDNIPTLKQIIGRTVRKQSHLLLPPEMHHVYVYLYTSCEPIKKNNTYNLSYEEIKYIEKMKHYLSIQKIEKILNENAIDSIINKNIIWKNDDTDDDDFNLLKYNPNYPIQLKKKQTFKLDELNLSTFNAFYSEDEINEIILLIKLLFIKISPVWTYSDLLESVVTPPINIKININTAVFSEKLFKIALFRLLLINDNEYKHPRYINIEKFDIINNFDNFYQKIIFLYNQYFRITNINDFYLLLPLKYNSFVPNKNYNICYTSIKKEDYTLININKLLHEQKTLYTYDSLKEKFISKWKYSHISNMEKTILYINIDFQITFIEECIEYIFKVWTDPKQKKNINHNFYFKMLYYYDLYNLIAWPHTSKKYILKLYTQFVNLDKIKNKNIIYQEENIPEYSSTILNLLDSTLSKSSLVWTPQVIKTQYKENLEKSHLLYKGTSKIKKRINKVSPQILPIGHFFDNIPKFYHPDKGWFESPEYSNIRSNTIENDIIIGYDMKLPNSIQIKFKIRSPVHKLKKYKDTRLVERGGICINKSKSFIKNIFLKLGLEFNNNYNMTEICDKIRKKLIINEMTERSKNTKVRWFYFIYEDAEFTI